MKQDEIKSLYALLLDKLGVPCDYSKPIELIVDDPKISPTPTRWLMERSGHVQFFPEFAPEYDLVPQSYDDQMLSV